MRCLGIRHMDEQIILEEPEFEQLDLTALQKYVEGYIEMPYRKIGDRYFYLVCNEEFGLIDGMQETLAFDKTGEIFLGNLLFVKIEGEDTVGLSDEEILYIRKHLIYTPESFEMPYIVV